MVHPVCILRTPEVNSNAQPPSQNKYVRSNSRKTIRGSILELRPALVLLVWTIIVCQVTMKRVSGLVL